ncbi:hypothetical protein CT0861_03057, partial [Colletotrichum tofieldiae]
LCVAGTTISIDWAHSQPSATLFAHGPFESQATASRIFATLNELVRPSKQRIYFRSLSVLHTDAYRPKARPLSIMYSNRSHPLLEQVPLTVSPFISLPTATTLSYNYKAMPSALPPSATGVPAAVTEDAAAAAGSGDGSVNKPKYVISQSGHAAHPDDIISSCRALQAHITKMQEDAERDLRELENRIQERELAEKRRVAPGWLDSEARILEPERVRGASEAEEAHQTSAVAGTSEMPLNDQGAELDRVFGGLSMK